jgi:hypothetical protein
MKAPPADAQAPVAVPDSFTEYEAGFLDGYMVARGIFEPSPREFQRAMAALKKSRQQAEAKAAEPADSVGT